MFQNHEPGNSLQGSGPVPTENENVTFPWEDLGLLSQPCGGHQGGHELGSPGSSEGHGRGTNVLPPGDRASCRLLSL